MNAPDAVAVLVRDLAAVQAQKAELDEREDHIKAALRRVADIGTTRIGDLTLSVVQARKFDLGQAARRYPLNAHPDLYATTLDPKRVKAALPPAEYDTLMVNNGEPRVSLR